MSEINSGTVVYGHVLKNMEWRIGRNLSHSKLVIICDIKNIDIKKGVYQWNLKIIMFLNIL